MSNGFRLFKISSTSANKPLHCPGHCNAESSGTVVKERNKELMQPVTINGAELRYEFDEEVYRRETGEQLPTDELRKAPTLNDLICRAFRNRG